MRQDSHRWDVVHAVRQYMALLEPVEGEATPRCVVGPPTSLISNPRRNGGLTLQPVTQRRGGKLAVVLCAVLCCIMRWCGVLCRVVLCCAVLCCVLLCCVVLCCVVLCCVVLCCVVLCCVVLCCVVLCCAVLCCVVLCCVVLCCAVLRCVVLCCVALCCAVLCCVVLCCVVLCCAVLCCAVLCCAALRCAVWCCFVLWVLCLLQLYHVVLSCLFQAYLNTLSVQQRNNLLLDTHSTTGDLDPARPPLNPHQLLTACLDAGTDLEAVAANAQTLCATLRYSAGAVEVSLVGQAIRVVEQLEGAILALNFDNNTTTQHWVAAASHCVEALYLLAGLGDEHCEALGRCGGVPLLMRFVPLVPNMALKSALLKLLAFASHLKPNSGLMVEAHGYRMLQLVLQVCPAPAHFLSCAAPMLCRPSRPTPCQIGSTPDRLRPSPCLCLCHAYAPVP